MGTSSLHELHESNFRLFHVSNLSVPNFRIRPLMYPESLTAASLAPPSPLPSRCRRRRRRLGRRQRLRQRRHPRLRTVPAQSDLDRLFTHTRGGSKSFRREGRLAHMGAANPGLNGAPWFDGGASVWLDFRKQHIPAIYNVAIQSAGYLTGSTAA